MSYLLSLEETARTDDEVIDVDGVPFVVAEWVRHVIEGLHIAVEERLGREVLVASHGTYGGTC